MRRFGDLHPIIVFLYFVIVIGFSTVLMNPICLVLSFICGFAYSAYLGGKKTVRANLRMLIPLAVGSVVFNAMFSHRGITVLAYLPSGNPLTLESLIYSAAAAVMLSSVFSWFSCFNKVMTSEKLMYLMGKIAPSLSLVFSMSLRFVPKFGKETQRVIEARKSIGKDIGTGGFTRRIKAATGVFSAMFSRALEESAETSDSMRGRGYGPAKRTSFARYRFFLRDICTAAVIVVLVLYLLMGKLSGSLDYLYFPSVPSVKTGIYDLTLYTAYAILSAIPILIELTEEIKWKYIKSEI